MVSIIFLEIDAKIDANADAVNIFFVSADVSGDKILIV